LVPGESNVAVRTLRRMHSTTSEERPVFSLEPAEATSPLGEILADTSTFPAIEGSDCSPLL
jgi:hypothetical protein